MQIVLSLAARTSR